MQHKIAALSRYDVREVDRVPHPLYAEEAQNFIGDFESFFSETRKFLVPLTIATQGIESLSAEDTAAVFTNCGTVVSFRVSGTDALRLSSEFALDISAANIQTLPDYTFYVRTLKSVERRMGTIGISHHAATDQCFQTVLIASPSCVTRGRNPNKFGTVDKDATRARSKSCAIPQT